MFDFYYCCYGILECEINVLYEVSAADKCVFKTLVGPLKLLTT